MFDLLARPAIAPSDGGSEAGHGAIFCPQSIWSGYLAALAHGL